MSKIYTSVLFFLLSVSYAEAQTISLTGPTYTQDFDALSNTAGSTTNNLTIPGWYLTEAGGGARDNEQYSVDAGASTTGDMYSYGAAGSTERALGELRSGTLIPLFGAAFTNNTGGTVTTLNISFTGEQWRLGTAGRTDQLSFEYSTDATSLTTGTWTAVASLNFVTPNTATTGAKDGNAAANRTALVAAITSLSIANGASFWIRWTDTDATGADDGLAVDDFSITASSGVVPLRLKNFSAVTENNGTRLNWTTEQEINSQSFIVERASGSGAWQPIATIAAAGNSNGIVDYSYTDANPVPGANLYRLRMLDKENKIAYSPTRSLNFIASYAFKIHPNPAQHFLLITPGKSSAAVSTLQIINSDGKAIVQKQLPAGAQPYRLNVQSLQPGVYCLRISSGNDAPVVLRFVKQ